MNSARDLACRVIDENYNVKFHDWNAVKSGLRDELSRLMFERTKRRPMILPILMEFNIIVFVNNSARKIPCRVHKSLVFTNIYKAP